jgi:hypothetical protein
MSDRSRYYILGAFLLGIALTTAYNKKRPIEEFDDESKDQLLARQHKWLSQLAKINDLETLKKTLLEFSGDEVADDVKEGIEGCIGNTPLIKIKSLSEFTGCDIFAKAEVQGAYKICSRKALTWSNSSSMELATARKTELLSASSKWYEENTVQEIVALAVVADLYIRPKRRDFSSHILVTLSTKAP